MYDGIPLIRDTLSGLSTQASFRTAPFWGKNMASRPWASEQPASGAALAQHESLRLVGGLNRFLLQACLAMMV